MSLQQNEDISSKSYFLWPKSKYPSFRDIFSTTTESEIESVLKSYWPNTYPVIFSSARSGLTAILQHMNLFRPDVVWCPPYSSHCVFESIARVATPTTVQVDKVRVALIYHQWGFANIYQWPKTAAIIEDSVDTLFIPQSNIFSNNGDYVLQSLPKVYGCISGGVVFCRNANDAIALKMIRKKRGYSKLQTALRVFSQKSSIAHEYWHGYESLQGGLPNTALSQILNKIRLLPDIVDGRLDFLEKISPSLAKYSNNTGRIPSNIPIIVTPGVKDIWCNTNIFSAGLRQFNVSLMYPEVKWKTVAPFPLHIDVSIDEFYKLLSFIKSKYKGEVADELNFI